MTLANVIDDTS